MLVTPVRLSAVGSKAFTVVVWNKLPEPGRDDINTVTDDFFVNV